VLKGTGHKWVEIFAREEKGTGEPSEAFPSDFDELCMIERFSGIYLDNLTV